MSKSFKVIFITVVTFSIVGIALLAYLYMEPVKNIAVQKTDIHITEENLVKDFNKNKEVADTKYKNKIIELSGTVSKTVTDDSICTVIFDNGGNFIVVANCYYDARNEIQELKPGNNIILKGIYSGYVINDNTFMIPAEIKIDKCTLVN